MLLSPLSLRKLHGFQELCQELKVETTNTLFLIVTDRHRFLKQNPRTINCKRTDLRLFSSVQLLSHVRLFATPWTAACQVSLYITNSRSLLKLMSIELVMPSNHLIFCHPLLHPPSISPSIRVFSNESVFCMRWPKYWSFIIIIFQNKIFQNFWTIV